MEWNQPWPGSPSARKVLPVAIRGEIIQIGAVRVTEDQQVTDEFQIMVKPKYYRHLNRRVSKLTGIKESRLREEGVPYPEAMEQFRQWCGEDIVFLTWGCDDVSVLQQNVDFFRVERELPKMYDIQRMYAAAVGKSGQTALKTAMEALEVEVEEERTFHNAMHDAYYTAEVFRKLPKPMDVFKYEEQPKKLTHNERRSRFRVTDTVPSVREAMESEKLVSPLCPTCNKPTKRQTELVPQAPGKYVALSKCQNHGIMFVKVRFSELPDGQKGMHLSVLPASHQNRAYVHTKELQYQLKRKRGDYDNVDVEDLSDTFMSNMPFEDA